MKHKKKKKQKTKSCFGCDCCLPIGEGDHLCDEIMEIVLCDYEPTEHFGGCVRHRKEKHNGSNHQSYQ